MNPIYENYLKISAPLISEVFHAYMEINMTIIHFS